MKNKARGRFGARNNWIKKLLCLSVFCLLAFPLTAQAEIFYVDGNISSPGGGGASWFTAFQDIQAAFEAANAGDEVWVKAGTYVPGTNRTATFQLRPGVALYGGFAGGESSREERDWAANETILSGDISGNDDGFNNNDENAYHVVTGADNAILDGFTISGGNANDESQASESGGGMYNFNSSPTVNNCTFQNNSAITHGGGMFNWDNSSPTVTNCTFLNNSGGSWGGGGMANVKSSSPTVTYCIFENNSTVSGGLGGGMENYDNASPTVTGCTFSGNSAGLGGGMMNFDNASPTVTSCAFSGNSANEGGGGMYNENASPTVADCTFANNSTIESGGGMLNWGRPSPTVTNCTFSGNSASKGGGGMYNHSLSWETEVTNCIFSGNSASDGGGIYGWSTVTNCTFSGNTAADSGGGIYGGSMVTNCTFSGNTATNDGGGMDITNSSAWVTNCTFFDNTASYGGGISNVDSSDTKLTNCIFQNNKASLKGGGIYNGHYSRIGVYNCTFSGNSASDGGGLSNNLTSLYMKNCILWDKNSDQISIDNPIATVVTYCDIKGGYPGTGNIDADPMFADPAGGDFHLLPGSPCIDAGDNEFMPYDEADLDQDGNIGERIPYDFEGDDRLFDDRSTPDTGNGTVPMVDIGADEFTFNTPEGTNVEVELTDELVLIFSEVTGKGVTNVTVSTTNPGTDSPGFTFLGNFYDITTTASFTGTISIRFSYNDAGMSMEEEEGLRILSWVPSSYEWEDITILPVDTVNNIVEGSTFSLSWFTIAVDSCPNDPGNDADGDGICGDVDNCPFYPNPDQADADGDGAGDACDACPNDPAKTNPGICGCGVSDVDTDGDGTADCEDNCPNDPNKTDPGICNCGVADTDSDSDGTADCNDNCPEDPAKTDQGICGCGVADVDTDGDGTADCNDNCPSDPDKTEPGICGCGAPDTDTDGDGTADCEDNCPNDPNKTDQGICGCGIADIDTDGDGTEDCNDNCPNDADNDADSDGVCGDVDNCPATANAGQVDADNDSLGDACDACPNDADNDADGDGICGDVDNCPATANAGQVDADNDSLGDACDACPNDADNDADGDGICGDVDNCPADANPDQSDVDQDDAGDICDICPSDQADMCDQSGSAAETIGEDGGSITAGTTTMEIPANALPVDTSISMTSYHPSDADAGFVVGEEFQPQGNVYDFKPEMTFDEPVTITFEYEQGNMEECGLVEQNLDIYRLDGAVWEPQNATQDCALNTLTITTNHFSFYMAALFGGKSTKADIAAELESALTGDRKVDKVINRMIKIIDKSLNDSYWLDEFHLNDKRGSKVFKYEALAVAATKLHIKHWNKKRGPTPEQAQAIEAFEAAIPRLVQVDRMLAEIAISEAKELSPTSKHWKRKAFEKFLLKADKAFERALWYVEKDKPWHAIELFKKAWNYARLAKKPAK